MKLHFKRTTDAPASTTDGTRYTYFDCLRGTVPVPLTPNGKALFQVLMVGGMVTFMVTINGIRTTGLAFLTQSHWLYPLMFAIAFLVRTFACGRLADALAPQLVFKRFEGPVRGIAMTALNVVCTAPVMCAIATLLLVGTGDFPTAYATTLPVVAPIAMLVNFFVVGPAAKLIYHRIAPADGLGLLYNLRQNVPSLTQILGF